MADTIVISCPGCDAIFELPTELGGQVGECTECGAIFEIPTIKAVDHGDFEKTDTGAVKPEVADNFDGAPTDTVKLSRSSVGMIPDVKDSFKFDEVEKKSSHSGVKSAPEGGAPGAPATKTGMRKTKSFKGGGASRRRSPSRNQSRPPRKQPTSSGGGKKTLLIVGIVVAVVVIAGIIIAVAI